MPPWTTASVNDGPRKMAVGPHLLVEKETLRLVRYRTVSDGLGLLLFLAVRIEDDYRLNLCRQLLRLRRFPFSVGRFGSFVGFPGNSSEDFSDPEVETGVEARSGGPGRGWDAGRQAEETGE